MSKKKEHWAAEILKRRQKRAVSAVERLLTRYPALRAAYRLAQKQFGGIAGVCGFGVGRKLHEKSDRYAPRHRQHGSLCVKVWVQRKIDPLDLPSDQRLPPFVWVKLPGRRRRQRVAIDVSAVGKPTLQRRTDHDWPTAGAIAVGRVFSFGLRPANGPSGTFAPSQAELGTIGALISLNDQNEEIVLACSAGHVFVDTCSGNYNAPAGARSLGCKGRTWVRTAAGGFLPLSLGNSRRLTDAMLFRVPAALLPQAASWPAEFDGKLATTEDIRTAIQSDEYCGFVWVEDGAAATPRRLSIDLMAAVDGMSAMACAGGRVINYGFVWPYRFETDQTVGGDSGAPVFLWSKNGRAARLLGFHFMLEEDLNRGYAADAQLFFREALGTDPGDGFDFFRAD